MHLMFCSVLLPYCKMFPFQSLGEQTDRKKGKTKKKKKEKVRDSKKKEESSSKKRCTEEATHADEEKRVEKTCLEILCAQARHIDELGDDIVSLEEEKKKVEGQKRQIEESLAQEWKEAFEEDRSQKDPFVRHLEESIREKKANLECPACLEVMDSYFVFSSTLVALQIIHVSDGVGWWVINVWTSVASRLGS